MLLEINGAIRKSAMPEVEERIYGPSVKNVIVARSVEGIVKLCIEPHLDVLMVEQVFKYFGIAINGYALYGVVIIIIVIVETHGQSFQDRGRKFGRLAAP